MYIKFMKRFLDIVLSLAGIVMLLPILLLTALLIKVESKGPLLFKQKRVGKNKAHFSMYKFRTMRIDAPSDVPTHEFRAPDKYITRIGRVLRKFSIDELPQLWNILLGDMSIIGPRPALWNQYDLIAERDLYGANDIRPGLTGWAQINGRDELEIPVKAAFDGEYVRKLNFLFDVRCLIGTVVSIFKHEGVVEGGTGALKRKAKSDK